jgi:hypothetical protein
MEAIQVIDSTHLVPLPTGQTVMIGSPPEALKMLVLWDFPAPDTVIVPPDPLYAEGMNQASFEFLLFNHLFLKDGLRDHVPFTIICDPEQKPNLERMVRHMLRGPGDEEMAAWRTPANHRRQLLMETTVVSGESAQLPIEQMARVVPFEDGRVILRGGAEVQRLSASEVRIRFNDESVDVPRRAQPRAPLPFYFADVEQPVVGPRLGLQVIGSASGFSGSEWGSCYIIWINGQPLVVDGTPYLDEHLRRLGIEDDHILGYLITHNHEDHANMIGQLVGRRPVTVLTSGPVMCTLVARLSALLNIPDEEVRSLIRWVPLHPGMESYGEPLHWFGADIRTWYSVHTIPTLGVDVSMNGLHIRMPGDTLWGRQLEPLLERKVITRARYDFIQHTYDGADVIVADAGGGPIHPDPHEVQELLEHHNGCKLMVTHVSEAARQYLPPADPGTAITLVPREERTPEQAMALFGSPVLRRVPERWLLALLYGGDVVDPGEAPIDFGDDAFVVLAGCVSLASGEEPRFPLQRGDVFHPGLLSKVPAPKLRSSALWTRLLRVPAQLYRAFVKDTGMAGELERLYRTRIWWKNIIGEEPGLDVLVELSQLCRERRFRPGADVVRQGDSATHFFIVTEGQVEVIFTNPQGRSRVIGSFSEGYHFGEIALIEQETRSATVRAAAPTQVLELPGKAFLRHLMNIPLARYRIHRVATARRAQLTNGEG